ncbi:MAG: class I tRNA ligase family protein, partial [Sphingopyxis sp.]
RRAVADFDFTAYVRALKEFMAEDLSAFFFDIRKDCLYCDVGPAQPLGTEKRRAYRTVLDVLFHALIRYAAPVLVFTAEEVWTTRCPDAGTVHLLEWPVVDAGASDAALLEKWDALRAARASVTEAIEPLRREKTVRSSLEAIVTMPAVAGVDAADMAEIAIVAAVSYADGPIGVVPTADHKCGRCWRHMPEVAADGDVCGRCADVLGEG